MARYRKKPVVIEARRVAGDDAEIDRVAAWCAGTVSWATFAKQGAGTTIAIPTLEGTMTASMGDWIIPGVQGKFYLCKPDVFAATYESAED